jgi:hypothetical protein
MSNHLKNAAAALCAIACLSLANARATTVIPPTFEEMVDRADIIFSGKVVSSRSEWRSVGANRVIFTLVEFETQEVLKGNADSKLTLQFLGGTLGNVTLEVAEVPRFNTGDRVLLFVEGNGTQFCPLVGVFHGKFGLRFDKKAGRDIVLKHDGNPLRDVGEIGNGEGADFAPKRAKVSIPQNTEPMLVDDFKQRVRTHLAQKTAP